MSEGKGILPKMPGQTPLSPPRGSGIPLVAMSDSIVPTLANLTLQQEQEQAMEAAVQQQHQHQRESSSVASSSSPSLPTPALQAGSSSIPSSLPTASNDAALPASSTSSSSSSSTSTLDTPNVQQQQEGVVVPSLNNPPVIAPPVIKSKDFAASMAAAAAAASSPSSSPADHSLRQPQVDGGSSSSPRSPLSSSSSTSTTTTTTTTSSSPATTSIASPPPVSTTATPTPRTATPSSSSSMASSASTSTVRPGLQPSASSSSAIRRPGVGGQGAGLAARIPPSLQAKMAAMAQRSSNPTQLQFAQNGSIGAQDRIPTSAFLRQSSTPPSSSSPGPSSSSSQQPSLGQSGPGRPSPMMMTGGAVGRVGSAGPMAMGPGGASRSASTPGIPTVGGGMGVSGMGGLKLPGVGGGIAKRRGPASGLNLNAMGTNGSSSDATSSSSSSGNTNGAPAATGGINGRAGRPAMKLPPASTNGSNSSIGGGGSNGTGTPFSNFSKIVDPSGSLNFQNKAVLHAKGVDFSTGASFNINMDELELQDELGSGNYGTVQKVYHKITKVTMAMKEIRLELDDSKLKGIITELDVLHRATAPEIVEFYGAFFIESCVYYCMEYMDAGSLDKMSVIPVPEPVLQRVTASMVRGLKFLKDKLQIMHRDVKPTNVLINTAGMVKLCDFGVSGQLERSLAKTNIGCQSYMAPERIKGESQNFLGTYTVSSDVWSLGLSIVEFTLGRYPYPPETYSNVFAQLTAIVHGDPPCLPDGYSKSADDFVAACLQKDANKRPSYAQLLRHPFLATEAEQDTDMIGWVKAAMEKRASMKNPPSSSSQTVQ